ncbi:hypothetical protein [sulfur-oxidizing endosymbiont of Gigantopelta aegis]|uniref:hypothetical protein n=1 Tax=sulfur-oxidizing endosymbiont of Gigantopelta aegis TaxID=2794934 RepID=UPI0018DCC091|nr:hypothetical protein [sulfur-oxidizing endosymbiont of Gigantopelta aegis]
MSAHPVDVLIRGLTCHPVIKCLQLFLLTSLLLQISSVYAANNTVPGMLNTHATQKSISIEWNITGDDNHNAVCLVKYRVRGSRQWQTMLPLYRVDFNAANTLAGSVLFLQPGTNYEVNLDLSDPEGGSDNRTLSIITRPVPKKAQHRTNLSCCASEWCWHGNRK